MQSEKSGKSVEYWLLLSMGILYFCANLQKIIIPGSTFNEVQNALMVDAAVVTRISSVFFCLYAMMQLVVGPLSDRFGSPRVMAVGALIMVAGGIMSSYLVSPSCLMLSRALTGIGAAVMYLPTVREISRLFPKTYVTFLGVLILVGYSGSIVGAAPFVAGVQKFGYHRMVLGAGLFCLATYVLFIGLFFKTEGHPVNKDVHISVKGYLDVFKNRMNVFLIINQGFTFGLYYIFQMVIGKKLLEDFCGLTANLAGLVTTVTMLIAAVNGFLAALIFRLINNRRKPFIYFASYGSLVGVLCIFVALLLDYHSGWLVITGMILAAFSGNISPIYTSTVKDINDENHFGTALSIGNSFAYVVPALLGGLCGRLMDFYEPTLLNGIKYYGRSSYLLALGMMLFFNVVAVITGVLLCRRSAEGVK